MHIQINTGHNIDGCEAMAAQVKSVVQDALSRFTAHITRVEVHLKDEGHHHNSGNGKRCMMEARLENHQPFAVAHQSATMDQAIDGAADKLARLIENKLGRLREHKGHRPEPSPAADGSEEFTR